jgi:calmodulin
MTTVKEVNSKVMDIPEEEIEEYRAAFNMFDKDGSGAISSKEFMKVLKNLGQSVTKEEASNIMKDIDADGSGEIDFDEFITYMRKVKIQEEINEEDAVIRAFMTFDVDKDDVISLDEFRHILCNLGSDRFSQDECDEIFKEADLNKDGVLNYREFVSYWRSK